MEIKPGEVAYIKVTFVEPLTDATGVFRSSAGNNLYVPFADVEAVEEVPLVIGDLVDTGAYGVGRIVGLCEDVAWVRFDTLSGFYLVDELERSDSEVDALEDPANAIIEPGPSQRRKSK